MLPASPRPVPLEGSHVDSKAVKANLLLLLEEQHRQATLWLQNHHDALLRAVEVALPAPTAESFAAPVESNGSCIPNPADDNDRHETKESFKASTSWNNSQKSLMAVQTEVSHRGSMWRQMTQEKKTTLLETATGILIVLNTLAMFVQLELDGRKGSKALMSTESSPAETSTADLVFLVLNHVFNAIFVAELVIKIVIYKREYFQSVFDLFDVVVVLVTSVDLYIVTQVSQRTSNISFLRTMRLLRLARLLRIIRMMNFFQQLRVLMHTMVLSFLSVFWSMLILLLFMLVSSLLLSQLVQDFVSDGGEDVRPSREWAARYYGTSSKSLYTVFEMTFSGCWPNYARELIEKVSPWYAAFFVPYVTLVIFTLIRLIYALLLKDTLQAAANDANLVVQDKMKEAKGLIKKLSDLFAEADTSGDGFLGRDEFDRILAFPRVRTWMNALGLNTQDTEQLFSILDDGEDPEGKISREAFVNGIMRMKGHAQKQDLLVSARDTHRILNHCKVLQEDLTVVQGLLRSVLRQSNLPMVSATTTAHI